MPTATLDCHATVAANWRRVNPIVFNRARSWRRQRAGSNWKGFARRRGSVVVRAAAVDRGTPVLERSSASLPRWGAVETGAIDVEVVQEGEGGFVCAFDEELGGVEVER